MPHTSQHHTDTDLQEIIARNETARSIVNGFSAALPTLAHFWQQIDTALIDTTALSADLAAIRLLRANLAAAARATLAAHHDGERDPFAYLSDELHAQGFLGGESE